MSFVRKETLNIPTKLFPELFHSRAPPTNAYSICVLHVFARSVGNSTDRENTATAAVALPAAVAFLVVVALPAVAALSAVAAVIVLEAVVEVLAATVIVPEAALEIREAVFADSLFITYKQQLGLCRPACLSACVFPTGKLIPYAQHCLKIVA